MRRCIAIVVTACLLAGVAGCKSNNADGRLIGTWLCTDVPNVPPGSGITAIWTFSADKSFSITLRGPGASKTFTGHYRLGAGDAVYFEQLSENMAGQDVLMDYITVNINQMTARDPDGTTTTLVRQ